MSTRKKRNIYASREEAKRAKWFSRRHETNEAHEAATVKYHRTSGRYARRVKAFLAMVTKVGSNRIGLDWQGKVKR